MSALFDGYEPGSGYDEMFEGGAPRPHYAALHRALAQMTPERYVELQEAADLEALSNGITFTVYAEDAGTER
jgi:uncharacterized circularly permuted ATP-grasp superfamily protein